MQLRQITSLHRIDARRSAAKPWCRNTTMNLLQNSPAR